MSTFWAWFILSAILLIVELSTGTFTLLFFAVSAAVVGIIEIYSPLELHLQIILFTVIGILGLLGFRNKIKMALQKEGARSDFGDVTQEVMIQTSLSPGSETQIEYQGTTFTAVNVSKTTIPPNSKCRIVETRGIKLNIVPVK